MKVFPPPTIVLMGQVAAAATLAGGLLAAATGLMALARWEATLGVRAQPLLALGVSAYGALTLGGWWLPAAAGLGALAAAERWRVEGAWRGLACCGLQDRFRGAVLLFLLMVNFAAGGVATTWLEPWASRQVARAADHVRWQLPPGAQVNLVGATLVGLPDPPGGVVGYGPGWTLVSTSSSREGAAIGLGPGAALGPMGWTEWGSLQLGPLPGRRIELAERGLGELAEVVARTEARGGEASSERRYRAKRWLHPLGAALGGAFAAQQLGGRRAVPRFVLGVLGWVLLGRWVDAAPEMGPPEAWALLVPGWWVALLLLGRSTT